MKLRKFQERRERDVQDEKGQEWGTKPSTSSTNRPGNSFEKDTPFIRYADDERLNAQQRTQPRWDDPARHFLPELQPAKPKHRTTENRFDIDPGKKWDGVDRSNGFEKKLFQKRASKQVIKGLEYQYGVEDF